MGLVVLPKTLVAHTDAVAADVMADLNALLAAINGGLNIENLSTALRAQLAESGDIKATGRAAPPSGWLMCEGQAVSRTTYAALFAALGTSYGAGDGATTFNLPDFRGRVPVGADGAAGRLSVSDARGQANGFESIGLEWGHLPAHAHGLSNVVIGGHHHTITMFQTTRHEGSGFGYEVWTPGGGAANTVATFWDDGEHPLHNLTDNAGANAPHYNMPPYQIVNYIIKY